MGEGENGVNETVITEELAQRDAEIERLKKRVAEMGGKGGNHVDT